ncbi:MAG: hypothetical protein CM15mP130_2770 [Verrucomicrobiota bacterium]|nr:MAG: hypothetical protein CM15mP130_2770 [Verrucomicrobiota bacterium]
MNTKPRGPDSYHPNKQAGEQGHVGDQALCLLRFLHGKRHGMMMPL